MKARSAIGVNIGTTCVRAAEVSLRGGSLRLERFGQVPLPQGAVLDGEVISAQAVADALRTLWKSVGFKSKGVILGVGNQRVVVRQVELPVMEEGDRRSSLRYQVADMIPMSTDEAVLDFVPLTRIDKAGTPMDRGLLIVAAQDSVLGAIEAARLAGLTTEQVDLSPFAVLRSTALAGRRASGGEAEAIVDIGARVTTIVVHEGGVPQFVRFLMMGGDSINDALVAKAGLRPAEASAVKRMPGVAVVGDAEVVQRVLDQAVGALVDEVRSSVDFFLASASGRRLARMVLTGGGSQVPGIADRLARAIRTPVVQGTPFEGLDTSKSALTPEQLAYVECMAAVPVGLALGGVS